MYLHELVLHKVFFYLGTNFIPSHKDYLKQVSIITHNLVVLFFLLYLIFYFLLSETHTSF